MIPFVFCLGIGLLLSVGLRLNPREIPSPLVNRLAPEFKLPRLLEEDVEFQTTNQRGKVWVLNVWASWCAACRTEHEVLKLLADEEIGELIGLNYKDEPLEALSWLRVFGNPYNQIAVDIVGDVGIDWGVYGVPETFVIDVDGIIRYKHIGPLNQSILEKEILPLMRRLVKKKG